MSPLGPGRIFWAAFPGARGAGKKRPMIIASRRTDILRTARLVAVVCSTDFDEPLLPTEVLLPSHPEGLCRTELRHATVAVCDWTRNSTRSRSRKPAASSRLSCCGRYVPWRGWRIPRRGRRLYRE